VDRARSKRGPRAVEARAARAARSIVRAVNTDRCAVGRSGRLPSRQRDQAHPAAWAQRWASRPRSSGGL